VRISSLRIDRFGVWQSLELNAFNDGLNVIYGPPGSGKTTVAQFLRAMLFGFGDEVRQRYIPVDSRGAGGSVTLRGQFGRETVQRYDDGNHQGRLIIESEDGQIVGEHRLRELLAGVPESLFDRVFAPGLLDRLNIGKLVDGAIAHGFDLIGSHGDEPRLGKAKQELASKRQSLAAVANHGKPIEELLNRSRNLQLEIEALGASARERRELLNRRLSKMALDISEVEQQLEELNWQLIDVEEDIKAHQEERRRKEEAIRQTKSQQERLLAKRREQLADMDAKLERWGRVLEDVETRAARLKQDPRADEPSAILGNADPRRYLRRLEESVDRLQKAVAAIGPADDALHCQCGQLQSILGPALQSMRDDVYRLCSQLTRWETTSLWTEGDGELHQLRRCETELRQAIRGLSLRRQELAAETGHADPVANHHAHDDLCQCIGHPPHICVDCACQAKPPLDEEEALAVLDGEIRQLVRRRDEIRMDVDMTKEALQQSRERIEQLRFEEDRDPENERRKLKQQELERVQKQIRDAEKQREMTAEIAKLEEEIRVLESSIRESSVLREASDVLRRLTVGKLHRISVAADRSVWICDQRGNRLVYDHLGSVARDQIYLSLCVALVAAGAREGIHLPLVLSDGLINFDSQGAEAIAAFLSDFAQRGHQVFLFTRHRYIADLFRSLNVPVRELPQFAMEKTEVVENTTSPPGAVDSPAWNAEEFPGELTDRVRSELSDEPGTASTADNDESTDDCFLMESSPIQDAPSIDSATAERLRKIEVLVVGDLLRLDVEDAADRLRYAGITAGMLRRWQAEALLTCRIVRLRPYDARILVACGITDPDQLARIDAGELCRRVEAFGSTSTGQTVLRSGTGYELSRVTKWIQLANSRRHGQWSSDRRSTRDRSHAPLDGTEPSRQTGRRGHDRSAREGREGRERTEGRERQSLRASSSRGSRSGPVVLKMDQGKEDWKFHLGTADPIEDAPSIGPRTAERFGTVGIKTVADFLQADPEATAKRLDYRRINADAIRRWQQQTALACRIPQMRGHDAQILVACGITDPEALAKMDAQALWEEVEPFVKTNEGKRIIRNGKAPDFEEVYSWIQWAGHARELRAA